MQNKAVTFLQRSSSLKMLAPVQCRGIVTPVPFTPQMMSHQASSRKISTKLLCDISGTRYYESNEEVDFEASRIVNVFDENNVNIGHMSYGEGFQLAQSLGKDIVLRNKAIDPPVMKIMDYKLELIKRVFKKLGREVKGADAKPKTIQMSSDISMHDLETRKRRAIDFLKQTSVVRFFMRVNVYDPENIQKGRLILLNVAEDLKEYSKIKVHPGGARASDKKTESPENEITKHMSAAELETQASKANFVKMNRAMINADEGDDDVDDEDMTKQYIYMELESTQGVLADIDFDAMFNSTNVEDFMRGISSRGTFAPDQNVPKQKTTADAMDMISTIMQGKRLDEDTQKASKVPKLEFDEQVKEASDMKDEEMLRNRAMHNLRERRLRLKSSAIFNAQQQVIKTVETKVASAKDSDMSSQEEEEYEAYGRDKVDLTVEQTQMADEDGIDDMDDFDLLDATIDPTDVKSLSRRNELEREIEYEQIFIKSKLLFKLALSDRNPMKVDE